MKYCPNCGAQLPDDARFCGSCGTTVDAQPAQPAYTQPVYTQAPPQNVNPYQVQLCEDGYYRWVYELNMFKNTAVLGTIFKIFGGIIVAIWLMLLIADGFDNFLENSKIMLLVLVGACVLIGLAYLMVAGMYGGKYCALFEMNETEVRHIQLPKQYKKAQVAGWIAVLAGVVAGNPTAVGAGVLSASRSTLTTKFSNVRRIKADPRRNLIKVNGTLKANQVYADDAQFQFVLDFLRAHCPNAR